MQWNKPRRKKIDNSYKAKFFRLKKKRTNKLEQIFAINKSEKGLISSISSKFTQSKKYMRKKEKVEERY